MATDASFIEYVREQAGLGDRLGYRKMFGEYALYVDGLVVALVCDDQVFGADPGGGGTGHLASLLPPYPREAAPAAGRRTRGPRALRPSARRHRRGTARAEPRARSKPQARRGRRSPAEPRSVGDAPSGDPARLPARAGRVPEDADRPCGTDVIFEAGAASRSLCGRPRQAMVHIA